MSKNNKGITLVELIVSIAIIGVIILEIFNIMSTSSIIYKNGSYDIELMTEAHQFISQVEELVIDANLKVETGPNRVDIYNRPGGHDYHISLRTIDPLTGTALKAPEAVLIVDGNEPVVMAEYVKSFETYMTNGVVTVVVDMQRERETDHYYTYSTSKQIYLRNEIFGAEAAPAGDKSLNDNNNPGEDGSSVMYDFELNVLRYHTYDLDELFNVGGNIASFVADSEVGDNGWFLLTGTNLKSTYSNDNDFDAQRTGYVLGLDGGGNRVCRIKVYCERVQIGMGKSGSEAYLSYQICYFNGNTDSSVRSNLAMFHGISADPEDIDSIETELIYGLTGRYAGSLDAADDEAEGSGSDYLDYKLHFKDVDTDKDLSFITTYNFFKETTDRLKDEDGNYIKTLDGEYLHRWEIDDSKIGYIRFNAFNDPEYEPEDFEYFCMDYREPPKSSRDVMYFMIDYNEYDGGEGSLAEISDLFWGDSDTYVTARRNGQTEKDLWFRIDNSVMGFNKDSNSMYIEADLFYPNGNAYYDYVKLGNQVFMDVTIHYKNMDTKEVTIRLIPTTVGGQEVSKHFWNLIDELELGRLENVRPEKVVEREKEEDDCACVKGGEDKLNDDYVTWLLNDPEMSAKVEVELLPGTGGGGGAGDADDEEGGDEEGGDEEGGDDDDAGDSGAGGDAGSDEE